MLPPTDRPPARFLSPRGRCGWHHPRSCLRSFLLDFLPPSPCAGSRLPVVLPLLLPRGVRGRRWWCALCPPPLNRGGETCPSPAMLWGPPAPNGFRLGLHGPAASASPRPVCWLAGGLARGALWRGDKRLKSPVPSRFSAGHMWRTGAVQRLAPSAPLCGLGADDRHSTQPSPISPSTPQFPGNGLRPLSFFIPPPLLRKCRFGVQPPIWQPCRSRPPDAGGPFVAELRIGFVRGPRTPIARCASQLEPAIRTIVPYLA